MPMSGSCAVGLDRREKGALISDYMEKRYGWLWQRTRGIPMDEATYEQARVWFDNLDLFLEGGHALEDAAQDIQQGTSDADSAGLQQMARVD